MNINKNHYYDGWFYSKFIDPGLRAVRDGIEAEISDGSSVVDLACGTGALSFSLAKKCRAVLGVELSMKMVAYAQSKIPAETEHLKFIHSDASQLPAIKDGTFDYATNAMALHEMPHGVGVAVVKEALRISKTVIFADYVPALPRNMQGIRSRLAEFFAGMDHFKGFQDFQARGGLPALVAEAGGTIEKSTLVRDSTVQIIVTHSI